MCELAVGVFDSLDIIVVVIVVLLELDIFDRSVNID
jgi:hypothetical protein